nr:MAG TPA: TRANSCRIPTIONAL COACTIVATOR PC4, TRANSCRIPTIONAL COFACTOR, TRANSCRIPTIONAL CO-ACTIVATOR.74A [Caudoviricetes sp.]
MEASKGNKVYTIDELEKEQYRNNGYDIYDENGEVVAYGKGKTIPYEQYAELKKQYEELKGQQEEPKKGKQTKKEGE